MTTSKTIVNATNEFDKELFKERVEYWKNKLGLQSWRINVPNGHAPGACADCWIDYPGRYARIRFGRSFGAEEVTAESVDQTALHEVLHVFLADLINTCHDKPKQDRLHNAEHQVINILELLLTSKG